MILHVVFTDIIGAGNDCAIACARIAFADFKIPAKMIAACASSGIYTFPEPCSIKFSTFVFAGILMWVAVMQQIFTAFDAFFIASGILWTELVITCAAFGQIAYPHRAAVI